VQFDSDTRGFGVMLRTSDDLESSYYVRFEPQSQRLVVDSWPRTKFEGGSMAGLDSWIQLDPGVPMKLTILVDRSTAVVYFGASSAMTFRMYDMRIGRWGFFVNQGSARFRSVTLSGI